MTDEEIQALKDELESTKTELEGERVETEKLAGEKETLATELETKGAAITTLEQAAGEKEAEISTLKQAATENGELLTDVNNNLSQAVSAYKTVVALANPAVLGELLTGDTIEAVDQSLESAKTLVAQVRQQVEAEALDGKVPAGAPVRSPPDLSALSPREKIQYAVSKEGGK